MVVLGGAPAAGCYVNRPLASPTPEPGSRIVLELSDRGRMALAGSLGPNVLTVSGRLVEASDSTYQLTVANTTTIDRRQVPWGGESVAVSRDHVGRIMERRLSKGRTVLAVVTLAAAVGVFVATRDLLGFGSGGNENGGGGGDTQ